MARPVILDLVNDDKLFQGKAFPEHQCRQPGAAWAVFQQVNFGPVRWCHVCFQQCTHFSCGLLHSMVCCCHLLHLCYRVRGSSISCTVCHRSRSLCSAANQWGLIGKRWTVPRAPFLLSSSPSGLSTMMHGQRTGRERCGKDTPPVCIELWKWGTPPVTRLKLCGLEQRRVMWSHLSWSVGEGH